MKQFRVALTDVERAELLLLVRRGKAPARTVLRAHILLRASEDAFDADTAAALHTSLNTVRRVRRRFAEAPTGERLRAALDDRPRPGAAPKLGSNQEAFLIALACSDPPTGRTCWTMQLLADRLVELHVIALIPDETVRRTLGNKGGPAVATCALVHRAGRGRRRLAPGGRPRPLRPAARPGASTGHLRRAAGPAPGRRPAPTRCAPGRPARLDDESVRAGPCNRLLCLAPHRGRRQVAVTARRAAGDFAPCMRALVDVYCPEAAVIRVVLDNRSTHTPAVLSRTSHPRRPGA